MKKKIKKFPTFGKLLVKKKSLRVGGNGKTPRFQNLHSSDGEIINFFLLHVLAFFGCIKQSEGEREERGRAREMGSYGMLAKRALFTETPVMVEVLNFVPLKKMG